MCDDDGSGNGDAYPIGGQRLDVITENRDRNRQLSTLIVNIVTDVQTE